jgi:hypothetical protein
LTIKNFAINFIQQSLKNQGQIYLHEQKELENHISLFNQEIFSVGGYNNAILNKDSYEKFIFQSFSNINFEVCDKSTLLTAINLITVFSMYGPLPDKYEKHMYFCKQKINLLDSQSKQSNQNQISQTNSIINTNNNTIVTSKQPVIDTQTNKVTQVNNSNANMEKKSVPIPINSNNYENLIIKQIRLPVNKGTKEYNDLKGIIKEHLMIAEQEALYNKIDISKAHIEAALYYLRKIEE